MKTYKLVVLVLLATFIFDSCGSSRSSASKEQIAAEIDNAIDKLIFTFEATYAFPMQGKPENIPPNHYVRVSPESIIVKLPYYGRNLGGSMSESGFDFVSRSFDHSLEDGKKEGVKLLKINLKDQNRPISFEFEIRKDGNTRLTVEDVNRQKISYEGDFDIK